MTIKIKLLAITVGLVAVSTSIIVILGLYAILQIEQDVQNISGETLRHQAEELLVQFSTSIAERNDLIFSKVYKDADATARYAEVLFANPDAFPLGTGWTFDEKMFKGTNGQYLNGKDDISSMFISNRVTLTKDLKQRVERSAYLDYVFPKTLANEPNAVAIWIIGPDEETRYYPNIELGNVLPPDQNSSDDVFMSVANPQNNPERKVVWTPVYDDPAGQGLMLTASAPIYINDVFWGVLGIDMTLNTIVKNIEEYNPTEGSYFFLIDRQGRAIALPDHVHQDMFGKQRAIGGFGEDLNTVTNEFAPILKRMKAGLKGSGEITVDTHELYVAYTPLEGTGFSIGAIIDRDIALKSVNDLQYEIRNTAQHMVLTIFLPSVAIILLTALLLAFFLSRAISQPLITLRDAVAQIGKGNMSADIQIETKDEIGDLAKTFGQMTSDLKESRIALEEHNKTLEQKVQDRTKDLEKRKSETEQMNKMMVGRELKMIEMKKELEEMRKNKKDDAS